jgi:hypothetical protein
VTGLIAFNIGAFAPPAAAAGLTAILPCGCTMIDTMLAHVLGEPGRDGIFHAAAVSGGGAVRDLGRPWSVPSVPITRRFVPLGALGVPRQLARGTSFAC